MENEKFCEQTEVDWEVILQRLPESPEICLDDFVLPLSTEEEPTGLLSLPSFGEDGNNEEAHRDSFGLWLSFLSNILFNDEDFEKFPVGEDGGGFIDINSFLADSSTSHVQDEHSADVFGSADEIEASEHQEIQLGVYVDSGKKGGLFLPLQVAVEKQEKASGQLSSFTKKRK